MHPLCSLFNTKTQQCMLYFRWQSVLQGYKAGLHTTAVTMPVARNNAKLNVLKAHCDASATKKQKSPIAPTPAGNS